MTPLRFSAAVALILAAAASTVKAQTIEQVVAYDALTRTPVGAVSPVLTNTLLDRLQNGASLAIRYGHLAAGTFQSTYNSAAVTAVLPASLGASFSLTAGAIQTNCTGCNTQLMLGAGGDYRIYSSAEGTARETSLFTVSLAGDLGYSNRDPGSFISGYVGVPVALVTRGNGMQFVPFITPGFGFGQESANGNSSSGSLFMVGGGLGIYNMLSSVTLNVGTQHLFVSGGQTMLGATLSFGGK